MLSLPDGLQWVDVRNKWKYRAGCSKQVDCGYMYTAQGGIVTRLVDSRAVQVSSLIDVICIQWINSYIIVK